MFEEYDAYYEAEANAAAAEAENEAAYYDFLDSLLKEGKYALYAAYVAIDWLKSEEFAKSTMNELEFIESKRRLLENPSNNF